MKERKRQIRGRPWKLTRTSVNCFTAVSPIARERYNNTGASIVSPIKSFNYASRRSPFDRSSNSLCSNLTNVIRVLVTFQLFRCASRRVKSWTFSMWRARFTGKLLPASFQLTGTLATLIRISKYSLQAELRFKNRIYSSSATISEFKSKYLNSSFFHD